jgi:hypothetical protein
VFKHPEVFLALFSGLATLVVAAGIWWSYHHFRKPKGRRIYCQNCHRMLSGDPMYCPWCGWKLRR